MVRDSPRDQLPGGALWNCVDWIPRKLGAPLRKRGGWAYASRVLGTSTFVNALIYAPFANGAQNIAVASDGNVYAFTTVSETAVGFAFNVAQNPVYHRSNSPTVGTVIIPAASGTVAPKFFDGNNYGNLGGGPPTGIYAAVWNDRTVLANSTVNPNRVWFGPAGNSAATWDTTNAWQDATLPITGVGVLKTAIMLFHLRSTERLRGTTPPSSTTIGDLQMDNAFDVGCIDARSIVNYNDTLIWADARGVYQTDGAALKDLTWNGDQGIRSYWRSILANYVGAVGGTTIVGGVYDDTYIVAVMSGTTFVDCLAYDLAHGFWYRLGNFPVRAFCRTGSTFEETLMGLGSVGRVASISPILSPSAATKDDADGTAVTPVMETGLFRGFTHIHRRWMPSMGLQQWKTLYFNYDLRDAAADNPTLTVSYATDPGATSYTAIARTLAETVKNTRAKRDFATNGGGIRSSGLMLKIAQTGASADTRLSAFEADYSPLEGSKLVQ
jgi:hypothetical protein